PITPAAPPRLSTRTCWPSAALSRSAVSRAIASTPPPAGNGTISVIGRDGQVSAAVGAIGAKPKAEMIANETAARRMGAIGKAPDYGPRYRGDDAAVAVVAKRTKTPG